MASALLSVLSCVLLILSASATAESPAVEDGVVVLTDSNFKSFLKTKDLVLVAFYAPWCGHCKRLAPEFSKAAIELANANPPVVLAKIDCTAQKKTCEKIGVHGYPTLKIVRGQSEGEFKDYKGPRTAEGIVKHMLAQVGPALIEVYSVEEAERFVPKPNGEGVPKVSVFWFSKDPRGDFERFREVAEAWRGMGITFLHTHEEEVLQHYRIRHSFAVFRPNEKPNRVEWPSTKGLNKEETKRFVAYHALPLAGELTEDNKDLYQARELTDVTLFTVTTTKSESRLNYITNRLRKLAIEYPKYSFKFADYKAFQQVYDRFAFTLDDIEGNLAVGMYEQGRDIRWKYNEKKFDVASMKTWLDNVQKGSVPKFIKSEPRPAQENGAGSGKVTVVTANTFDEIVKNKNHDVLLELYAPWCGHCKKLAPIYDSLAADYKGVNDLVIAKMDATQNDSPGGYTASGFPTIFYAPKRSKDSPEKFSGDRTLEGFKKYLKEKRGK